MAIAAGNDNTYNGDIQRVPVDDYVAPSEVAIPQDGWRGNAEGYFRIKKRTLEQQPIYNKIMSIFSTGIISTILGILKMFVGTIVADAGIPAQDQASAVTLIDNLIGYLQSPSTPVAEFLADVDSIVQILTDVKSRATPDISKALAAIIGALEGLKTELTPAPAAGA